MKKIISFLSIVILSVSLVGCFDFTEETPEPEKVDLWFDSVAVEYNNVKYSCGGGIECWLPYGTDKTSLRLYFTLADDRASLYINDVKQTSGESVFDFTNDVPIVIKDKQGNEQTAVITIRYEYNTEAKLYSLSVMLYNSATSAYDLEYLCAVDEANKKVTVDFGAKTKNDLKSVKYKFVISDNAIFSLEGSYITSEVTVLDISSPYGISTITIKAEDTTYKTDYQFTRTCSDCGE